MRKITILIIALATVCGGASAQQKQGHARIPISRDTGKGTVVDHTKVRVWYALNADKTDDMNTYIDCQRLDIGDSITKYYSWFVFNSDSLRADWSKKHRGAKSAPMWLGPGGKKQDNWCQYEWSDFYVSGGQLTEYACMPSKLGQYNSYYTEPWPQMTWTLGTEHQTIIGYDCQKATCHWRGRDYEAWFTAAIPVKAGPWKFGGLPGLIMKVYDTRHVYTWEAVAVENGSFPIYQPEERYYKKSTREKVWKMQGEWNRRFNELSGMLDFNFRPKTQRYPYDPLELE